MHNATLAQLVEHQFCKLRVVGSTPTGGSNFKEKYFIKKVGLEVAIFKKVVNGRLILFSRHLTASIVVSSLDTTPSKLFITRGKKKRRS